ncbi:MAG: radical SAM/SPASM domain-containing protein [Candidatus Xenobia bacterium]
MAETQYRRRTHTNVVWEITLKCNLACSHCGSRAGEARSDELSTAEALDLVQQLKEVGIREVTLIGGEAFLRADWLDIARAVTEAGMICTMTTGGYGINASTAARMREAGIVSVSVSVDGLESTHDGLRGRKGSWRFCLETMGHLEKAGITVGNNTQINRLSAVELPRLYQVLRDHGMKGWQIQMTVPMGNAADNASILMQPAELLDLYPMLARIVKRAYADGVLVSTGNNIGYFGPYERLFRGGGKPQEWIFWQGCQAGLAVLGIEADGAIKGCPSLPTTAYTGGNIRQRSLRDIVANAPELTMNLDESVSHLWGFCSTCDFARVCRGGCSWTAHVFFDRRGNNPYCHHRALQLASKGIRERVYRTVAAQGKPFDNGLFELVEEPLESPWPSDDPLRFTADRVVWPEDWQDV